MRDWKKHYKELVRRERNPHSPGINNCYTKQAEEEDHILTQNN